MQGFHRSVHEANHEVESGVGCGDSVAPGELCTSVEVGGTAGSNPSHTGRLGTRCTGCEFAADGESIARGARVPFVMRGAFRAALRVGLKEIIQGVEAQSEIRAVRAWKSLLLLPRMLLFRPTRGGLVSRKQLEARVRRFQAGHWISLLDESFVFAEKGHTVFFRARRRHHPEEAKRAARAVMADFGQTDIGQLFDRLWPIVGLTDFGQTDFGQIYCFSVLAKFSQPTKHKPINPKDLKKT